MFSSKRWPRPMPSRERSFFSTQGLPSSPTPCVSSYTESTRRSRRGYAGRCRESSCQQRRRGRAPRRRATPPPHLQRASVRVRRHRARSQRGARCRAAKRVGGAARGLVGASRRWCLPSRLREAGVPLAPSRPRGRNGVKWSTPYSLRTPPTRPGCYVCQYVLRQPAATKTRAWCRLGAGATRCVGKALLAQLPGADGGG